jgi:uncharacterized repeat protein (TIGR01451 family)
MTESGTIGLLSRARLWPLCLAVMLGLILACPSLAHAVTISGQISLNTDDADQDGIPATTQLFDTRNELGLTRHFGFRFTGFAIPDGATILSASIQFTSESSGTQNSPSNRIVGEAADNAPTFVEATNNITNRTTTAASVIWNYPPWPGKNKSDPPQQTPDISAIIQEIVDRPGWTSGNALVLIFEPNGGDDNRLAHTYDGSPADAAVLTVEYSTGLPALLVMKATFTLEDPVNGTTDPKAIPGATERYLVEVTNTGTGTVDADTMFISDPIPANMALRVVDYDGGNPGPVAFVDGSPVSGLTYTFTSLGSGTDDVEFSDDGGSTWTYTPVDSGDGTDPAVTDIRINPKGIFAASGGGGDPSFQVRFKAVVQ